MPTTKRGFRARSKRRARGEPSPSFPIGGGPRGGLRGSPQDGPNPNYIPLGGRDSRGQEESMAGHLDRASPCSPRARRPRQGHGSMARRKHSAGVLARTEDDHRDACPEITAEAPRVDGMGVPFPSRPPGMPAMVPRGSCGRVAAPGWFRSSSLGPSAGRAPLGQGTRRRSPIGQYHQATKRATAGMGWQLSRPRGSGKRKASPAFSIRNP